GLLDEVDEPAETTPRHRADLWVLAGCVGLHLSAEPVAVGADQLAVRRSHRVQRLLARLALGRLLEGLERLREAALDRGDEELLLRAKEPEQVRLRDAGPAGDLVGRAAPQAVLGAHLERGIEHVLPALVCGLARGSDYRH